MEGMEAIGISCVIFKKENTCILKIGDWKVEVGLALSQIVVCGRRSPNCEVFYIRQETRQIKKA